MWPLDWSKLRDILVYNPEEPMIFNSGFFLFLFLGFSFVYMLLRKQRMTTLRLLFVSLFSYYFYYKSSGMYFYLLAVVTVTDFVLARQTSGHSQPVYQSGIVMLLQIHEFLL